MAEPGKPMSFAAIAQKKREVETPLRQVQVEGQVILKIVEHCKGAFPNLVTGQLLGLDIGQTLEVTDCFPFPNVGGDENEVSETDGQNYQLDMMRCLREVNVDNNTIGWYQSTIFGSYQTLELIETFQNYAESIKRCVCLVYDPMQSSQGGLSLKAIKLKDKFMEVYKTGKFTVEAMRNAGVNWQDIFQEIPIHVHNSSLATALMGQLAPTAPALQCDFDRLVLSAEPLLEKNLEFVTECLDDMMAEQSKVAVYHRNAARQQAQMAQWLQKRRQENAQRRAAGEDPLPEEDPTFKPVVEPSQVDSYLTTTQIKSHCDQITTLGKQSLQRLYVMQAVHKVKN
mmetsp:Transcript_15706/g.43938  ORF Transcript_15706/g.43938 Transcript_15706/m.43938 type:complete len:341 (-) Transcript_15706:202-1224(-)|eukprot:CAMPEP_0117670962 /NCGR_PEP_ID=MMETSP0804-20121206/13064_1 /TAXON_ID=1074897 /ORGANISM="Tetraselmis astigmatica, Strain CCMP880" /LENGTH=340 /DNA_ID=CAMNT_0005479359 /DNA_START=185 /DNA_END=1207 /DNA_ORIENTATION=+